MYFAYRVPYWLFFTFPLASLYATVFVLGRVSAQNELVAIYNSGMNTQRLMLPVYISMFILSGALMVWDKEILYDNHQKHRLILKKMRGEANEPQGPAIRRDLSVFGQNNKIYFIRTFHQHSNAMQDTHILFFDTKMNFEKIISARWIEYEPSAGEWRGRDVLVRTFDRSNHMKAEHFSNSVVKLEELPYHFQETEEWLELLSARDTLRLAKKYEIIGGNSNRWYTDYYSKTASPFIALVVVFLGVPLSVFSRRSTLILSFLLVLIIAFLFYITNQIGNSLGSKGYLPPFLAGWFGNIFFLVTAYFLNRRLLN